MTELSGDFRPTDTEIMKDLDETWEAIHPYESLGIDSLILTYAQSSTRYSDYGEGLNDQEKRAYSLLNDRYAELLVQDNAGGITRHRSESGYRNDACGRHYDKVRRVMQEWMNRYFLLRVEPISTEDYESYLHSKIFNTDIREITNPLDKNEIVSTIASDDTRFGKMYRALADIEMVPLYGSSSIKLLVPPHVEVRGELGHSRIMRWSEIKSHDEAYLSLQRNIGSAAYKAGYQDRLHAARLELN